MGTNSYTRVYTVEYYSLAVITADDIEENSSIIFKTHNVGEISNSKYIK